MQDRITVRACGDPPDLLICPVSVKSAVRFSPPSDLIAHGARAAERAIDSIRRRSTFWHRLRPPAQRSVEKKD